MRSFLPFAQRFAAFVLVLLLAACAAPAPPPNPTAVPSPTATPTPAPTPTATPLPPVNLTIQWPATTSTLEDIVVQVALPDLAARDPAAQVWARVTDPDHRIWWEAVLERTDDGTYAAPILLHLPLESAPGNWLLTVFVQTSTEVGGVRTLRFRPEPVLLRTLTGVIREGITLHIPQAFPSAHGEGDGVAGGHTWNGADGQVGLWWAPGPAEPLSLDTAWTFVAATHPTDGSAEILSAEEIEWHGLAAFHFSERWDEGPAETLVVQGSDRWLYVLRVRALEQGTISPLLRDIQAGFRVP